MGSAGPRSFPTVDAVITSQVVISPYRDMKPTCTHREVEHVFLRPSL